MGRSATQAERCDFGGFTEDCGGSCQAAGPDRPRVTAWPCAVRSSASNPAYVEEAEVTEETGSHRATKQRSTNGGEELQRGRPFHHPGMDASDI
jgi:hypothetical protein